LGSLNSYSTQLGVHYIAPNEEKGKIAVRK